MVYQQVRLSLAALCICWAIAAGGCEQPPAATTNQVLAPGEKHDLTQADWAEMQAALRSISTDATAVQRPSRAPGGSRWSDVPLAVDWAVAERGVEMAVVQMIRHDEAGGVITKKMRRAGSLIWSYTFHLKTIEDRPATLIVKRRSDDQVYDASATVGRFEDDQQRADKLLAKFDYMMRKFGRKRQFNEDDAP